MEVNIYQIASRRYNNAGPADATGAAALGPAPCCSGRLFIFARYSMHSRIQS